MTGDLPTISDQVEIRGPGRDKVTIDGGDQHDLFYFNQSANVSGLTIANGGYSQGGAIYTAGALTLDGVRLTGGEGISEGGALHIATSGSLTMTDSEITGNSASVGGGIWAAGNVTITDSKIAGNTATSSFGGGGGLRITGGSVQISGTEISGNTATNYGGIGVAQSLDSGVVTISDSTITGNNATATGESVPGSGGGGITSGNATITGTEISGNGSSSITGGIALSGNATVTSSLIAGNQAGGSSAGLTLTGGDPNNESSGNFTVTNTTITGNVAGQFGGGIVSGINQLKIEASTIAGNTVTSPSSPSNGGAGITQIAGNAKLVNSIVSGNSPADIAPVTTLPGPLPPFPLPPGTIEGEFSLVGTAAAGSLTATVTGSNIASTNPKLGPLADNGGKLRTMLPADGSPVIDKGLSSLPTDQRGMARPVDVASIANATGGNGADIGAVELQITEVDPDPPAPSNQFSFGRYKVNKKTGVATLQVKVPGKGKLLVLGSKKVAKSSTTAKRASTVKVKIKAKGKAAKTLRKKGKAKVKIKVRFTPTGGKARTKAKAIKLTKKKAKRR